MLTHRVSTMELRIGLAVPIRERLYTKGIHQVQWLVPAELTDDNTVESNRHFIHLPVQHDTPRSVLSKQYVFACQILTLVLGARDYDC